MSTWKLARQADVIVVAPATVHTIAKLAVGMADDPLTTTVVASKAPLMVAPAMDADMFEHPATQENLERLHQRGAVIAGPGRGRLASGLTGWGRLLENPGTSGLHRLHPGARRRPEGPYHRGSAPVAPPSR